MWSGVVNVTVFPLTDAISLTSEVGRSVRENQLIDSGKTPGVLSYGPLAFEALQSSCHCCIGRCMFHETRSPCQTCASKPVGHGCHDAPERSSSSTNSPAVKPDAFAMVTDVPPCAPSATRACEVLSSGRVHRCGPMITIGCASYE